MSVYYNEIDKNAAAWLRQLIKMKLIPDGIVDERSIEDVKPHELMDYTQCHFFAGIGGWNLALQRAGWDENRKIWTGSCPCQPFSSAGKGRGVVDERHLWPAFHWLIDQCRPDIVVGEQVESAIKHGWIDLVQTDLERSGYSSGAIGFPACGVGAPHKRQRLYWVGENAARLGRRGRGDEDHSREVGSLQTQRLLPSGGVADVLGERHEGRLSGRKDSGREDLAGHAGRSGSVGGVADSKIKHGGSGLREDKQKLDRAESSDTGCNDGPGQVNGFWGGADWLFCTDGKWRPVEPGSFPLVDGAPSSVVSSSDLSIEDCKATKEARSMRLKGYGNAIVIPQAEMFIRAVMGG